MNRVIILLAFLALSSCASTPSERLLDRCSLCDTAIAGTISCPSCGVLAYEPTFLSPEEENTAQAQALDKLVNLPDGFEVFVSSSPARKPSWTNGGLTRIEKAVGVRVRVGRSGDAGTETAARQLAADNAQQEMSGAALPVQWYVERLLRRTQAGVLTIYRASVLSFGQSEPRQEVHTQ